MTIGNQDLGNQTLGRGKVYFSLFKTGTQTPEGFRYIGNTPDFGLTIANEKLEHFSSDAGVKVKDRAVILQTDATATLGFDDIQAENLAIYFFGEADVLTQTSGTGVTETFTDAIAGRTYQIGMTDGNPSGVRSVTVTLVNVGGDTMTSGTDYIVDTDHGMITFVDGGDIVTGDDVVVTYNRAAKSRIQIISGTQEIEGCIKFIADNPEGDNFDYLMPFVRLSPNGEFSLKGDDWMKGSLNVEILKGDNRERIYVDGQPYTAA